MGTRAGAVGISFLLKEESEDLSVNKNKWGSGYKYTTGY